MYTVLKTSGLDYVAVMPPHIAGQWKNYWSITEFSFREGSFFFHNDWDETCSDFSECNLLLGFPILQVTFLWLSAMWWQKICWKDEPSPSTIWDTSLSSVSPHQSGMERLWESVESTNNEDASIYFMSMYNQKEKGTSTHEWRDILGSISN